MAEMESGEAPDGPEESASPSRAATLVPDLTTDLTIPERTLAWWQSTHALRGSFYADVLTPHRLLAAPAFPPSEHSRMSESTTPTGPKIVTAFDQGAPPSLALDNGTTKLTFVYEFGGYHANYDTNGSPAYRYALRDASGADTILGPVIDVEKFNAYCDANSIPREPSIQTPPVPVTLTPSDAAAVSAHPAVVATPSQPATHTLVETSLWQRVKTKLVDLGHDVEKIL